ncbi:DUF7853 family protein [Halalkalicoccus subterraneus]
MSSSSEKKQPLSLRRDEQWTLHHVLLHRLEQGFSDPNSAPPPADVFWSFTTLDSGEVSFTDAELRAIESVLAEYHHSTGWWASERSRLESLLHRVPSVRDTSCRSQGMVLDGRLVAVDYEMVYHEEWMFDPLCWRWSKFLRRDTPYTAATNLEISERDHSGRVSSRHRRLVEEMHYSTILSRRSIKNLGRKPKRRARH